MKMSNKRGFTLIETIITLVIMAVLTTLAARTIQQAFRAKAKIEDQIDLVSQVKDALRMFERDVNLAYHYLDIEKEFKESYQESIKKKCQTPGPGGGRPGGGGAGGEGGAGGGGNPGGGAGANNEICKTPGYDKAYLVKTENRIDPTTQFEAKEDSLNFVTSNSVRFVKDSPQADFGEVGYFVDSCKNRPDKQFASGKCLFRRFSPIVDKDVTKGGTATQLLTDVTEFKLKYYSKPQKDWRGDWNSKEDGGDPNTKGRYPEAVEVNLTIEPPMKSAQQKDKKKKVSIQMIIPIHFPNNREAKGGANQNANPNGNPNFMPPTEDF